MSLVLIVIALAAVSSSAAPSPRTVVLAMFEAFNRHDAAAMAAFYAEDARLDSSDFCQTRVGRGEVERTYRALFDAFPDIHDKVEDLVVHDGRIVVRFVATSGVGQRSFALPITTFLTVKDGLILADDSHFDTGGRACTP